MEVQVTSREVGDRSVVSVAGQIDLYTADGLREPLATLVEDGHRDVLVDLTEVGFMDSTALGVLVGARKKVLSRGGRIQLVIASERLLKIFRLTALTQVFTIHETLHEALGEAPAD